MNACQILFSLTAFSFALSAGAAESVCHAEIQKFCPEQKEIREIGKCLRLHDTELSVSCKEELQRMIEASKQASSRSGGALGSFSGLNLLSPPVPMIAVEGRAVPGHDQTPSLNENRANISAPIFRTATDSLSVSLAGGQTHFSEPILLDSNVLVPNDLKRVEIGAQYFHQLPEKKDWGVRASLGYAGDEIFNGTRDMSFTLTAHYGLPFEENHKWAYVIFLSNNSPIANYVPIPGFVYFYKTENFTGIFGFPFASFQWTPAFPWSVSVSLFGPTFSSELAYGSVDRFQLFTGFAWTRQNYLLSDRVNEKDRLTIAEKKFQAGIRTPLFWTVAGEFVVGNSFDRTVFIGNGFLNKDGGSATLESSLYAGWNFRALF